MKYLLNYKLFESSNNDITIYDVSWLYLLCYPYNKKFPIKSWENDKRMDIVTTCDTSLSKFSCVIKEDGYYIADDSAIKIIDTWFGAKTLKECLIKGDSLKKFNKGDRYTNYPISTIPKELYLRKNPNINKSISRINNRIIDHYNSQICSDYIIDIMSKSRHIDEFNLIEYHRAFPDFPKTIKIYRGVKNKPNNRYNHRKYSCWTHDKSQAERFAKFKFTGGQQFEPIYSDDPHILEAEVNIEDIVIFVGGYESEVIVRNPVHNAISYKLPKSTKIYPSH